MTLIPINKLKRQNTILCFVLLLTACTSNVSKDTISVNDTINKSIETTNAPKRFGMVTGVKSDKIEYYKKLHAAVWPAVLKKIKECNIQDYSIYLQKINNDYFLFSYFEYVGNDFNKDMKKMAADSTTQRWWMETDPTQEPLPEAKAAHNVWTEMKEVFHTN